MKKIVLSVLIVFTLLVSCSKEDDPAPDYTVTVGEVFQISMFQSAGASTPWYWERPQSSIVDSVGCTVIPESSNPGAAAIVVWKLKGRRAGNETLKFMYNGAGNDKRTKLVNVKVLQL